MAAPNDLNFYINLYKDTPDAVDDYHITRSAKYCAILKKFMKEILNIDIDIVEPPNMQEKLLSLYNNHPAILLYFIVLAHTHYTNNIPKQYGYFSIIFIKTCVSFLKINNYNKLEKCLTFMYYNIIKHLSISEPSIPAIKSDLSFEDTCIIIENIIQIANYYMDKIEDKIDLNNLYRLINIPYYFLYKMLISNKINIKQKNIILKIYLKYNCFDKLFNKYSFFADGYLYNAFYKYLYENKLTLASYNYDLIKFLPSEETNLLVYLINTKGSKLRFYWIKAVVLYTLFIKK